MYWSSRSLGQPVFAVRSLIFLLFSDVTYCSCKILVIKSYWLQRMKTVSTPCCYFPTLLPPSNSWTPSPLPFSLPTQYHLNTFHHFISLCDSSIGPLSSAENLLSHSTQVHTCTHTRKHAKTHTHTHTPLLFPMSVSWVYHRYINPVGLKITVWHCISLVTTPYCMFYEYL